MPGNDLWRHLIGAINNPERVIYLVTALEIKQGMMQDLLTGRIRLI
jgi:hypothetical protein